MNPNISIPPSAADAYRAMLAEQTYPSLEEATIENVSQLDEASDEDDYNSLKNVFNGVID